MPRTLENATQKELEEDLQRRYAANRRNDARYVMRAPMNPMRNR